ncbi:MAG: hypothetical protein KDC27_22175 [Acidobacteria bacterium]|nr:hypothetical protein [Acidobacteriota bacterium]
MSIGANSAEVQAAQPQTGWTQWAGRAAMAAVEQGSVSGSNLVLSVGLARMISPADYGLYAVAFSMLLLGAAIYQSVFLLPLMVHAPRLRPEERAGYLRALLRMHGWGAAALLALTSLVCGLGPLASAQFPTRLVWASAFTMETLSLQWLLRDSHYLSLAPSAPARGSLVYSIALLLGLLLLGLTQMASAWAAILLMGVAALASAALLLAALWKDLHVHDEAVNIAYVWRESRKLARWEFWISIAGWAPVHLTFPVTAGVLGPVATGALRALQNFAMPLNQLVVALSRLLLPYLCGRSEEGVSPVAQGRKIAWFALAAGLAYTTAFWSIAAPLVHLVYGGAYDEHAWLMPLAILPMAFWGGAQSLGLALRAANRFSPVLTATITAGLVFAAAIVPATRSYGVAGALGAAAGSQFLGLALMAFFARPNDEAGGVLDPVPVDGGGA